MICCGNSIIIFSRDSSIVFFLGSRKIVVQECLWRFRPDFFSAIPPEIPPKNYSTKFSRIFPRNIYSGMYSVNHEGFLFRNLNDIQNNPGDSTGSMPRVISDQTSDEIPVKLLIIDSLSCYSRG